MAQWQSFIYFVKDYFLIVFLHILTAFVTFGNYVLPKGHDVYLNV